MLCLPLLRLASLLAGRRFFGALAGRLADWLAGWLDAAFLERSATRITKKIVPKLSYGTGSSRHGALRALTLRGRCANGVTRCLPFRLSVSPPTPSAYLVSFRLLLACLAAAFSVSRWLLSQALAYTCYQMYARQKTGLAPEMVNFERGKVRRHPCTPMHAPCDVYVTPPDANHLYTTCYLRLRENERRFEGSNKQGRKGL